MRVFEEYNGFIFEYESRKEWWMTLLGRFLGNVAGALVLGLMGYICYLIGSAN